jgi:toxin CcdB
MTQFLVHRHKTRVDGPLLLDIQSSLVEALTTRVVIPLYPMTRGQRNITQLTPTVMVQGRRHLAAVPELAGVPASMLGEPVADLSRERATILAAIDLLITGI